MSKWISVEYELPKSGVEVKVKTNYGEIHYLSRGTICPECWYSLGYRTIIKPTHWMPIPPKQNSSKPLKER